MGELGARLNIYQRFTYGVVTTTEKFFYNLGLKVGAKPIETIAICWVLVIACSLGGLRFYQEKNPMKLWVPPDSQFAKDSEWLMKTLELGFRQELIILTAPNVLVPEVINELLEIHERVGKIKTPGNITWDDICFKIPKVDKAMAKMLARETENGSQDLTATMDITMLCSFLEAIPLGCFQQSLLELWNYNRNEIQKLTTESIIHRINNHQEMLYMGHLKNYTGLLSGIQKNETGHIIAASALQNIWMTKVNFSAVDMDKVGNIAGTADWASEESLEWELEYENVIKESSKNLSDEMKLYYISGRTFGDVTSKSMFQDMDKILIGGFIMAIYVVFVISKFNMIEMRVGLAGVGLLSVGMSFIVGCGLCFLIGIPYGPVHTSLPFLLMGLGVDDMFVIMACFDELSEDQKKLPIPDVLGLMLKHAGVSITITSVTDIIAFLIGSSTVIPNLQSYCIYAAVCVLMTFVFAVTFFCAGFALDQKRIAAGKNGIIPCITHEKYKPNECSRKQISNRVFHFIFDRILLWTPVKVAVILLTTCLAVISINNCFKLEQRFDPHWFVPKTSELHTYFQKRAELYPNYGFEGGVYMGAINYTHEIPKIREIVENMRLKSDVIAGVSDWLTPFRDFVKRTYVTDIYEEPIDEVHFNLYLSKFLINPQYAKYQSNFQFETPLECGIPAPKIKMAYIAFNFPTFEGPSEYLPAMHKVREIAESANFTTGDRFCTTWSVVFATWVTDEVIDIEVLRNLQLALLSVMICTLLLVADIQTCFWIFICVLLSMVNVCGFMQMWGLTIDLVSCIGLELAIGLCVDYATHIGHTFLTVNGSRRERAVRTMTSIGSAVVYGGLSTLIGVLMLSFSDAYIFQAFFKIFFLVISFGLYHGVIVMPVILSIVGPQPYSNLHKKKHQVAMEEMKCMKPNTRENTENDS
ncbi:protein patched homolog 1-like [Coccinella septempunctata]|uniref:protein patched homolog 1-like n=1 Tax=Coccinella septempunctata TaxID=41139 RepID=UPI001D06F46E|nr:protein patched homolog 1-like [Coccinella septempunctata]XP_044763217.1 protein patched homolog 1-like [Coccinella septempunctata]